MKASKPLLEAKGWHSDWQQFNLHSKDSPLFSYLVCASCGEQLGNRLYRAPEEQTTYTHTTFGMGFEIDAEWIQRTTGMHDMQMGGPEPDARTARAIAETLESCRRDMERAFWSGRKKTG